MAWALKDWCRWAGTASAYIEPGSPCQNALAESGIGLFKTKLHRNLAVLAANGGFWRGLDDLEAATCRWVSWFNQTGSMASSMTPPQPRSKPPTTVSGLGLTRYERSNRTSLYQTQADSGWLASQELGLDHADGRRKSAAFGRVQRRWPPTARRRRPARRANEEECV